MEAALAVYDIEEAFYDWPAEIIDPHKIDQTEAMEIWQRVATAMDDRSMDPKSFIMSLLSKTTVLFRFGDDDGLIWVYQLVQGDSAALSFVFDGNWKGFRQKYGSPRDAQRKVISWFMSEFKLEKLRSFIAVGNPRAWKMAERVGFKREGELRREYVRHGTWDDLYAYGILKEEFDA